MVFSELRDAYLDHLLLMRQLSPETLRAYRSDLAEFEKFLLNEKGKPNWIISAKQYLTDLRRSGASPATCQRRWACLKMFLSFCGWTSEKLRDLGRAPKVIAQTRKQMTEAMMSDLLGGKEGVGVFDSKIQVRDLAICELLYSSGLRAAELIGLNLDSINLNDGWVLVLGKGRKFRQVPVNEIAIIKIQNYLSDWKIIKNERVKSLQTKGQKKEDPLFRNLQGERLHIRSLSRIVKRARPDLHPHLFRHAFATHLLQRGADLRSIQEMLGHSNLSTTEKYTHLTLEEIQVAFELLHPLRHGKPLK